MLHIFLTEHRTELIDRCRMKVAQRDPEGARDAERVNGIPSFIDQVIRTLRIEQTAHPMQSRKISGPAGGGVPILSEIGESATLHGRELLHDGFTIEQVVHDYGDLCQAVTDLASEKSVQLDIDEFRTFNRCLDNAIATAVTEFTYQHDCDIADQHGYELNERLGFFAHELRNLLSAATLSLAAIKAGNVGVRGATAAVLDRSLSGIRNLIDRSLSEVRVTAGLPAQHRQFSLAHFIAEVKAVAMLEAKARDCKLTVSVVDPELAVDADRDLLLAAVGNLLQNAFKFTKHGTEVTLHAYSSADRILIDVKDNCGGLPSGDPERMFQPFTQAGADRSGLGLGLSISRRSVTANNGHLSVRDVPGSGCVFTIELPRHLWRHVASVTPLHLRSA